MAVKSFSEREMDWEKVQSRFPAIAFELCFGSYEKRSCFYDEKGFLNSLGPKGLLYSSDIEKEIKEQKENLVLEELDVLYVYGVGLGYFYQEMKSWLHEKKNRKILFFEEDLSVLDVLFRQDVGEEILEDVQVHLYYVSKEELWMDVLDECIHRWMSDRIDWTTLKSYLVGREKKVRSLKLKLLRRSACIHAKIGESLHYPMLMENIASNLTYLPHSFHANHLKDKGKNIPAIICGAGYSLGIEAEHLKQLQHKAFVISGGSALTAMAQYGIFPHIGIAVDPNEEEYARLKTLSCFETPFIYSSRLHKDILPSTNLQMGYLCSNTGGLFEAWMHEKLGIHTRSFALDLGEEALSVTTLALAFAVEMGCNPIIFCGVDLAYTHKQRYCPGVMSSSSVSLKEMERVKRSRDQMVKRKNKEGQYVYTLVKWVMEASCLGAYTKKHPEISFFNLSSKGVPIPNVPTISWEDLLTHHLTCEYDLKGLLHAEAQALFFTPESVLSLQEGFSILKNSFEKTIPLFTQMLQEIQTRKDKVYEKEFHFRSGKMIVIEMDLLEEPAYEVCFQQIFSIYQGMLDWWNPSSNQGDIPQERMEFLEKKEKLWTAGREVAEKCFALLKNY